MKHVLICFSMMCCAASAAVNWPVSKPESEGFDPARLEALKKDAAAHHTRGLLIARNGRIVFEWYAEDAGPDTKFGTASLAKALVGGMPLLVALSDGRIRPDDLAVKYIPRWKNDPRKSRITIRQLATHTSGIEDAEEAGLPHDRLPGWKGAFWQRKPDPISIALDHAPVIFEPGKGNQYSNPGMAALAYAVTASLRGAPESSLDAVLARRICGPLGIPESDWRIGYGESYELDGLRVFANWGGANFTARAAARIGQLMLQKGNWEGRQLVSREWLEKATSYAGMPIQERKEDPANPASGLCWWTNFDGAWAKVPRDAFAGAGAGQQVLLVVPSLKLVVVRNGGYLGPAGARRFWGDIVEHVFQPVLAAMGPQHAAAPYPPSPAIRKVASAPADKIVSKAIGSDNWPVTWADDDDLYTSTGFRAVNLRSEPAERTGAGLVLARVPRKRIRERDADLEL